jgi:L,D-transpeptidase YcbB
MHGVHLMMHSARIVVLALALSALLPVGLAAAVETLPAAQRAGSGATDDQRAALRSLLDSPSLLIAGQMLDDVPGLRRLYEAAGYDLLWIGKDDRIAALAQAFSGATDDGLDVPAPLPDPFKTKTTDPVARDLLLSDAALRLATALATGRARPEQWEDDWAVPPPSFDAAAGLDHALTQGKLGLWLAGLAPSDPRYVRLKGALAHYRQLAAQEPWPRIPGGPTLKPGMTDPRIPLVRLRLIAEGYLPTDVPGDDSLDSTLETAVNDFQVRHGIVGDGTVGARTVAAMNVSARARVEQIALTLERWRSLPREFGRNYALVNVPGESLEIFEDGTSVLTMKVVVGDPNHPTPVVQSRISAITFNPVWHIPTSIAQKEIVPKIKADPKYLAKNDMVQKGSYVFEQLAGPKNPLGQIKFETPNKFDVYLHDTSTHTAFERVARALSHGCVRTENARELAAYVLSGPKWNPEEIEKVIATTETQKVDVVRHLRVSILYFTSFVDADGTIEFRDDLYGRDKRLRAALSGNNASVAVNPPPKPGVG